MKIIGYIKGLLALTLIALIWSAFLLSNPWGWHRLLLQELTFMVLMLIMLSSAGKKMMRLLTGCSLA